MSESSTIKNTHLPQENQKHPWQVMLEIASAYQVSQMIYVVTKLGIVDLLKDGTKHCDELATATDTHSTSLYRLLRALASHGFFVETQFRCFQLTPLGGCLQTDIRGNVPGSIIWEEQAFKTFGNLLHSVKTGESAFENLYSISFWQYCKENPALGEVFNQLMVNITKSDESAILEAYDFLSIKKLVDIGGGIGALIAAILKENSTMNGVLFEQPEVIEKAQNFLDREGVSNRCEVIGGSFFEEIPAGADAYVIKRVIHDWDDEQAIKILQRCCQAMTETSKLLVLESVMSTTNARRDETMLDIWMLLYFPGAQERTKNEYQNLFRAAGLKLNKIIPTKSGVSIIEVIKDI